MLAALPTPPVKTMSIMASFVHGSLTWFSAVNVVEHLALSILWGHYDDILFGGSNSN